MQLVFPNPVRLANVARQQNIKPSTALLLLGGAAIGIYFLTRKPKTEESVTTEPKLVTFVPPA